MEKPDLEQLLNKMGYSKAVIDKILVWYVTDHPEISRSNPF